jgi:hypothetical protein
MLALVICQIFLAWVPGHLVHNLCYLVTNPEISHFHFSQLLPFYCIVCDANGGCIITMHWHFWLGMAKVGQSLPKNYTVLAIMEESAQLSFRCWHHHKT